MKRLALLLLGCFALCQIHAADLEWLTDLNAAKAKAKKENKILMLDFTGSDWCGWCIKLNKEVFTQPEFAEYAKKNLVLVELDFPAKKPQSPELKAANKKLQAEHQVRGFPTIIAMSPEGKVLWKQPGYLAGGPKAFIAKLDEARKGGS
ncbi:MAG TPA: thioredoxin family protein [Verrucomicrobiae bacterium]|jgi:protein disulfide-isomerase